MFQPGARYRIFIYDHGTDGRKSHNGLAVIVRQQIQQDCTLGTYPLVFNLRQIGFAKTITAMTIFCALP